jgi:transposase
VNHVAIDLGSKTSRICVTSESGVIVEECDRPTGRLRSFLGKQPKSRVILETCSEAFKVADMAKELGHDVRVVPSTLAPSLGVGQRGIKTDARDARVLAEASCRVELRSVHIPTATARERKAMCAMRESLVSARTQLINSARGYLRQQLRQLPKGGTTATFPARVRKLFSETSPTPIPDFLDWVLKSIDTLTGQIVEADKKCEEIAQDDPTCRRLMSAPGVGPITAIRFSAAVDEVERFSSAHRLQSYLGLTPGENSSSERKRRTGLTKAGQPRVRWALTQAAWAARRYYKADPMVSWSLQVEQRRGKKIAIIALARKLAGVLFAVWRDQSTYNASHPAHAM